MDKCLYLLQLLGFSAFPKQSNSMLSINIFFLSIIMMNFNQPFVNLPIVRCSSLFQPKFYIDSINRFQIIFFIDLIKVIIKLCTVWLVLQLAATKLGVFLDMYTHDNVTVANAKCFASKGYTRITTGVLSGPEGFDDSQVQKMINIKNAGLKLELGFYPCVSRDLVQEAKDFLRIIPRMLYDRVWVLPASYLTNKDPDDCQWHITNHTEICKALIEMRNQFKKNRVEMGLATFPSYWMELVETNCSQLSSQPLYWISGDELCFKQQQQYQEQLMKQLLVSKQPTYLSLLLLLSLYIGRV